MRQIWLILLLIPLIAAGSCRRAGNEFVTVALSDKITGLDTLSVSVAGSDASGHVWTTLRAAQTASANAPCPRLVLIEVTRGVYRETSGAPGASGRDGGAARGIES